jgi:cell volume regulation protein A
MVAKMLKLDLPLANRISYPLEFEKTKDIDAELTDLIVPYDSEIVGKNISELGIPEKCLIVLISRNGKFVIPFGSSVIESGDVLLVLANTADFIAFQHTVARLKKQQS